MAAAWILRGMTGFGSGLLMVPLLALLVDIRLVVPVSVMMGWLGGIFLLLTFGTRHHIRWDLLPSLLAGGLAGTAVGTYGLATFANETLERMCGVFIAGYALHMLFTARGRTSRVGKRLGGLAGLAGGVLGGMFGTGGPPVIVYVRSRTETKASFRATLIMHFAVIGTWHIAAFAYAGLYTDDALRFLAWMLPAFFLGNLAGSYWSVQIPHRIFDRGVAAVLVVTGLLLIIRPG